MRRTGKSKPCVWRWQARFMTEGVGGLLRDKTRPWQVPPLGARGGGARGGADADRSAGGDHPLDRRHDGEGGRHQRQFGPAHLARPRAPAAPGPAVQALQRSAVRREAARRGRALSRPAGARHRALGRREVPNPGARPHPARPADEEGPRRHDDPRLQAARHHHALRRAERARRHRDRPKHSSGTATRSSSASSTPSRPRCRLATKSTPSSTTTPRTSTRRCARGSTAIPAGPSTSCRHPAPGSTPSRASSPSSRSAGSSAGPSTPSSTSRPPSTASSMSITQNRAPSPGLPIRTGSSQPSGEGTKC